MPWKMDDKGALVLSDGHPIWIGDDNKEMTVKGDTIQRLNGEAKSHREAKEAAEAKLQAFAGLDATDVRNKLEKYKDVDLNKLVAAGKLDEVRAEVTKQAGEKIKAAETERDSMRSKLDNMLLMSAFKDSRFMTDRVVIPAEMMLGTFGKYFKVENDTIVPYGKDGSKLPSSKNLGEVASFDEALEIHVEAYPHKQSILRAPNATGSGNDGGGGHRPGSKYMKRSEFDGLPAVKRAEVAAQMAKGEVTITD